MMALLRRWFHAVLEVAILTVGAYAGALHKLWVVDVTKLSIVCLGTLVLVTAFIGLLTYRAERGRISEVEPHLELCWFTSELLMAFGMVGTVLGFLIMLNEAFSGTMQAQQVMLRAAPGLGTICVTTAFGLICSMFCKAQLVNLNYVLPE
jgi:hypothetical protein